MICLLNLPLEIRDLTKIVSMIQSYESLLVFFQTLCASMMQLLLRQLVLLSRFVILWCTNYIIHLIYKSFRWTSFQWTHQRNLPQKNFEEEELRREVKKSLFHAYISRHGSIASFFLRWNSQLNHMQHYSQVNMNTNRINAINGRSRLSLRIRRVV